MDNRIRAVFYAVTGFLLLFSLLGVPAVGGFLSLLLGSTWSDSFLAPLVGMTRAPAVNLFSLCLIGVVLDNTLGLGDETLDDFKETWPHFPIAAKIFLVPLLLLVALMNLDSMVLTLTNLVQGLAPVHDFYRELPMLGFLRSSWFSTSTVNFMTASLMCGLIVYIYLNAPDWMMIHNPGRTVAGTQTATYLMMSPGQRKMLRKAEAAMEKGRILRAAKLYISLGNDYTYRAAKLYSQKGEDRKAKEAFFKAGAYYVKRGNYARSGLSYYNGGYWEKAVEAFEKSSMTTVGDMERKQQYMEIWAEALTHLERFEEGGSLYMEHGFFRKAGEAFEQGGHSTKAAEAYAGMGAYESSIKALEKGGHEDLARLEKGKQLMLKDQYQEAAIEFERGGHFMQAGDAWSRAKVPKQAAKCYREAGKYEMAAEMFLTEGEAEKAMECYVALEDYQKAANLAAHLGFQDKQAEYYRKCEHFVAAGRSYLMIGETAEAVECFRQADVDDPATIGECARILNILYEQNRMREALGCAYGLLEGRKAKPELAPLLFCLAKIHEKLSNMEKAARLFFQVADMRPDIAGYVKEAVRIAPAAGTTYVPKKERPPAPRQHPEPAPAPPASIEPTQALGHHHEHLTRKFDHSPEPAKVDLDDTNRSDPESLDITTTLDEDTVFDLTQKGELRRYRVVKEIGKGGMGNVYKAVDQKLKRAVALKVLHPEHNKDPRVVLFFKREALAIAGLNHPNLVSLYDMGKESGCFYMIMEHVEGNTLEKLMKRNHTFLMRNLVAVWYQACVGLNYAHENGIIHRDLKPSNIMLTKDRRVKILDFGLAKEITDISQTKQIWGTPTFMAPELLRGERANFQTDIYGLGATIYMLVTKHEPFSKGGIAKKLSGDGLPRHPKELSPGMSDQMADTIMKCMYLNPKRRFQSMDELLARLRVLGKAKGGAGRKTGRKA